MNLLKYNLFAAIALSMGTANAAFFVIDFESDDQGNTLLEGNSGNSAPNVAGIDIEASQPFANFFGTGSGVNFSSIGMGDKEGILTLYDTDIRDGVNGNDDDLEPNFEGGNGSLTGGYGNSLILQEGGATGDIDDPNDNGDGAIIQMDFDIALVEFNFSMIDLDDNKVAASTLTFTDTFSNQSVTISFADLEGSSTSVFSGTGVDFGDDHANDISTINIANLQTINSSLTQFDQVILDADGSGGLAEISFETVPEPSSALLVALGAFSLVTRRRR